MQSSLNLKAFKLAILQTKCTSIKQDNIQYIRQALIKAGSNGAQVSVLGEICNSPYVRDYMIKYAEEFDDVGMGEAGHLGKSPTLSMIAQVCLEQKMYCIGTIPRKYSSPTSQSPLYYNTAFIVSPTGTLLHTYNKMHLFDIDIPNKITYKESNTFTPGNRILTFQTQYCMFGIGICYDLRFSELGLLMAGKGARVLLYPGSFNQVTGPLHWELLLRGRALDTQCYTVGVSVAQNKEESGMYQAWGHSTVVDPFGKVLVGMDQNPGISYCEINPEYTEQVRTNIPLRQQKRKDIYKLQQIK